MFIEGHKPSETFKYISIIGGLFLIANLAFSQKTRKEIGSRDRWHCQTCGVDWNGGFMLHASHYNHNQSEPEYDSPSNGRMQCVDCHQQYHEEHVGSAGEIGLTEAENLAAIALLSNTERGHK